MARREKGPVTYHDVLRTTLSHALEGADTVLLQDAVATINALQTVVVPLDGMAVSRLLRSIGWNRDHRTSARAPIAYRRSRA